jgi:hypothetical protein
MYLAIATRPDLSYAVGVLAQFNSKPNPEHWRAVKRVMRYLRGTTSYCLTLGSVNKNDKDEKTDAYKKTDESEGIFLHGYSDADYAGDKEKRKSTSGYAFFYGRGCVSWSSKKQPVIALSTTEAEYIAAVFAGQEGVWIRGMLKDLGKDQEGPTSLFIDNQSTISVSKNPELHSRMKHIDVRFHWLREKVAERIFEPRYKSTQEMTADIFTKALDQENFKKNRERLGVLELGGSVKGNNSRVP